MDGMYMKMQGIYQRKIETQIKASALMESDPDVKPRHLSSTKKSSKYYSQKKRRSRSPPRTNNSNQNRSDIELSQLLEKCKLKKKESNNMDFSDLNSEPIFQDDMSPEYEVAVNGFDRAKEIIMRL